MGVPPPAPPFATTGPPPSGRSARTFKPRRGRLSRAEAEAVERLLPPYLLAPSTEVLAIDDLVIDIGVGNGETTVALAEEHPDRTVLAIDVHTPGFGVLARALHERAIANVHIVDADALDVLTWMCADGSVAVANVAFPDPWPKPSQQHRRLVDARFADLLTRKLAPGGRFTFASDWEPYALAVRSIFGQHADFVPDDVWTARPRTKFERRGITAGRTITDLAFARR